ncbi:MAG: energy-coupling factor ABC transporter permease [Micropruina sp.]|nr:energy-coupling factor ABC transporter permease [Micropruina sp.]
MHIAEGFLPPVQAAAWFAVSAPFVIHGARAVIAESRRTPENTLLLAVAGAFTFVPRRLLPSVTGSSSHPTGTGVGAILFGPPVMAFLGTVVLVFQALLLAHGGLTTLGANVFALAIAGPWAGYGAWRLARSIRLPRAVGIFAAMAVADLTTYVVSSAQLALAHPDVGSGVVGSLAKFLGIFALTQVPLAVAEGILGVLLFRFLDQVARPHLVRLGLAAEEPVHA